MDINALVAALFALAGILAKGLFDFLVKRQRNDMTDRAQLFSELKTELERLQMRVERLEHENGKLHKEIADLREENAQLKEENKWLKAKVEKMGG